MGLWCANGMQWRFLFSSFAHDCFPLGLLPRSHLYQPLPGSGWELSLLWHLASQAAIPPGLSLRVLRVAGFFGFSLFCLLSSPGHLVLQQTQEEEPLGRTKAGSQRSYSEWPRKDARKILCFLRDLRENAKGPGYSRDHNLP